LRELHERGLRRRDVHARQLHGFVDRLDRLQQNFLADAGILDGLPDLHVCVDRVAQAAARALREVEQRDLRAVVFLGAAGDEPDPRVQRVQLVRGADQSDRAGQRREAGHEAADGARSTAGAGFEALQRVAAARLAGRLAYASEVLPQAGERTLDLGELGTDSELEVSRHVAGPSRRSSTPCRQPGPSWLRLRRRGAAAAPASRSRPGRRQPARA